MAFWKSHMPPAARTATTTTTPATLDRIRYPPGPADAPDYGIVAVAEQHLFRVRKTRSLAAP
jgi:hypothetical protein